MKIVESNVKIVCDVLGCDNIAKYLLVLDVGGSDTMRLCPDCLKSFYDEARAAFNRAPKNGDIADSFNNYCGDKTHDESDRDQTNADNEKLADEKDARFEKVSDEKDDGENDDKTNDVKDGKDEKKSVKKIGNKTGKKTAAKSRAANGKKTAAKKKTKTVRIIKLG